MSTKIGRNSPCPCNSGKKYKHCHGSIAEPASGQLPPEAMQALRAHQAAEKMRVQQQGHGRQIISFESHGYRMVCVGKRVFWGQTWGIFPDFLMHYMKNVLGMEWGHRESQNDSTKHPLFRWLQKFQDYRGKMNGGAGKIKFAPTVGYAASVHHLAYALYLLEHHDQIPKKLLKRLRDPLTVLPAYYEVLMGAMFAIAGFEIVCKEVKKTSGPVPEFTVTSKASGKSYDVEAKRKDSWKATVHDASNEAFRDEMVQYIRNRLYDASKKRLKNPIFCIELSLPALNTEKVWREIVEVIKSAIRAAENDIKIDGIKAGAAYVVITNHSFLADEDIQGDPIFAYLEPFNVPDFVPQGIADMEEGLAAYDRHRDIMWALKCLPIACKIPVTFDGTPEELLDADGQHQPAIKIGARIEFPDEKGVLRTGVIEELTGCGQDYAYAIVLEDERRVRSVITVPLTPEEKSASARYGNAIFGKPDDSGKLGEDDVFGLYDWVLKNNNAMTREQVLRQLGAHPMIEEYKKLTDTDLRIRVSREMTKSIYISSKKNNINNATMNKEELV